MTTKNRFLASKIKHWFSDHIYSTDNTYKFKHANSEPRVIPSTCSYYTTHFILNYATYPTKSPEFKDYYHFDNYKGLDTLQLNTFWDTFKTNLFANNSDNNHQLFHFRWNNFPFKQQEHSIHDLLIEKHENEYLIYQSMLNYWELFHWLDTAPNNGYMVWSKQNEFSIVFQKFYKYAQNTYGSSKVLSNKDMQKYLKQLEEHCTSMAHISNNIYTETATFGQERHQNWDQNILEKDIYEFYGSFDDIQNVDQTLLTEVLNNCYEKASQSFENDEDEEIYKYFEGMNLNSMGLAYLFGIPVKNFLDSLN